MNKSTIMLGMIFGSVIGGYVPTLWGASAFGLASVFGSFIGGVLGIWLTYRLLN